MVQEAWAESIEATDTLTPSHPQHTLNSSSARPYTLSTPSSHPQQTLNYLVQEVWGGSIEATEAEEDARKEGLK